MSAEQKSRLDNLPPPSGYKEKIKAIVDAELRDPYSAHYRFTDPRKAFFTNGFDVSKGAGVTGVGYAEIVYVNAKNGFGGYTGEQPMFFTISETGDVHECTADLFRMTVHIEE
jgi:hypothetical protein